jgi:hypothetical protein
VGNQSGHVNRATVRFEVQPGVISCDTVEVARDDQTGRLVGLHELVQRHNALVEELNQRDREDAARLQEVRDVLATKRWVDRGSARPPR